MATLEIQCDLLDPLATRVVVPLAPEGTTRARSMQTLTPTIRVEENAQHGRRPDRPASPHGFQGPLAATVPVLMRLSM